MARLVGHPWQRRWLSLEATQTQIACDLTRIRPANAIESEFFISQLSTFNFFPARLRNSQTRRNRRIENNPWKLIFGEDYSDRRKWSRIVQGCDRDIHPWPV